MVKNQTEGECGLPQNVQLVINRDDLRVVVKEVVGEVIAEQLEGMAMRRRAEEDQIVEQHVLADEVGKCPETLTRWAKAGRITRVPDTVGREVYYYRNQFSREMAALAAKKAMKVKEVNEDE